MERIWLHSRHARKLRIEYEGAINRGDRREPIFIDEADRQRFVETLAEVCAKTRWQVHAYVLMPNHFHLVVETPQPNLVARDEMVSGHLHQPLQPAAQTLGPSLRRSLQTLIVDGSGNGYLRCVCDYVHLNPARGRGRGMLLVDQPLKRFAWSSWPAYLLAPSKRPAWLRVDRLLGEWGIPKDSPAGRRQLERALEARRGEDDEEFNLLRRGWCLGDETFRRELLAQMRKGIGAEHYGEERAQTAEAMAEQIIAEELKRRRWKETALRTRPKGDPSKVGLAARLRAETTMTVGWIAERLGMGSRGYLNHLLYRQRKSRGK